MVIKALRYSKENGPFDLLVTDVVMPGALQGPMLATEIRKSVPDLPVVFLSGYASEATVHGNNVRPEDPRLIKPVPRAELIETINRVLGSKGKP